MKRFAAGWPTPLVGAAASIAAVAVVTGAIELLKAQVPVLSLAVLYVLAVIPIAIRWGLLYGIGVSLLSMAAFNFFFLPPLYTLTLQDSRNWFALAVFLVTAMVVSELAARQRRQARESALIAQVATSLLEQGSVTAELDRIAEETARVLEVERARIDLGSGGPPAIVPLGRRRGSEGARRRLLPALSSLLGVAIEREQLSREALEAEALRRSDAVKTAVLRAVSHDLRSPLMAILTSAEALARRDFALAEGDRRELEEAILQEARRLDRLVSNLLDLSRLQAGAAVPEPDLWDVDDLVAQALGGLAEAGGRVELSLPDEPPAVRVDIDQIERVLVNLLENSLRYSSGPVRVQVTGTGSDVLVRVVDRGPGIPPAELDQIFEPFQRGSGGATVGGAGLGLAITRGFAEANGGHVWAESRPGQGTTFVLALPRAGTPAPVPA
jgi:two-component system, OmpR family, sensor histidine kinase KdpD